MANSITGGSVIWNFDVDNKNLRQGLRDAKREVDNVARSTAKSAGDSLKSFGKSTEKVGRSLTKNVTLPIIALGTAIFKVGMDFEASMNKIVGLVGISRDQVGQWGQELLTLGPKLGKSPKELADALFFVTSAGLRGEKAMEALTAAAKASAAGLGETAVVADAVTSAMNAYTKTGLSATEATDILTAAVRAGKLEASSLAPVLGALLPTASAMGVRFHDVAGVLAVMSRTGLDAATAATSLNAVMSALLKPSKQAKDVIEDAGLSFKELRGVIAQPGGVIEVMRLLDREFSDNDEALAQIIPNVRAFRGVMNVLAQDGSIVDQVMSDVANSVGITDDAFAAVESGSGFKFKQAMAEVQATLIKLGDDVMPVIARALTGLSNTLQKGTRWWERQSDTTKKLVINIALFAAVAGPALIIIGKMAIGLGALVKLFGVFKGASAVAGATGAVTKFGFAAKAAMLLMNPWVLGIGAVALGAGFLVKKFIDSRKRTDDFGDSAKKARKSLTPFSDSISTAVDSSTKLNVRLKETNRGIELLTLNTSAVKNAERDRVQVKAKLAEIEKQEPGIRNAVRDATKAANDAQQDYNEKIAKYGEFSFEAEQAGDRLRLSQEKLQVALGNSASWTLRVEDAKRKLGDSNLYLESTTNSLKLTQKLLKEGLDSMISVVKSIGPISLAQVKPIATLQSSLQKVANLSGDLGQVGMSLGNISNNVIQVTRDAKTLQKTVNGIRLQSGSAGTNLQGGTVNLQGGLAEGGPVSSGSSYLVGEEGPEIFTANKSGRIIPNDEIGAPGGVTNHIGTINIASEVDGRRWLEKLTRDSEIISKGMTPSLL